MGLGLGVGLDEGEHAEHGEASIVDLHVEAAGLG